MVLQTRPSVHRCMISLQDNRGDNEASVLGVGVGVSVGMEAVGRDRLVASGLDIAVPAGNG